MMKKLVVFILAFALAFALSVTAFASDMPIRGAGPGGRFRGAAESPRHGMQTGGGIGLRGAGFNFFWDADGNFLNRDAVEANLDAAVANGDITAAERDLLLERYERCAANGGSAVSVRGGRIGCRAGRGGGVGRIAARAQQGS